MTDPRDLRTVYLGQFDEARAEQISRILDEQGIAWFPKRFGGITRFFFADAWGVRMFVDSSRIKEATDIVSRMNQTPADRGDQDATSSESDL